MRTSECVLILIRKVWWWSLKCNSNNIVNVCSTFVYNCKRDELLTMASSQCILFSIISPLFFAKRVWMRGLEIYYPCRQLFNQPVYCTPKFYLARYMNQKQWIIQVVMDTNTRWDIAEVYYYYYYYYTMDLASINFASYNPSSYGFLKLIELLILFKFFYLYYYLRGWWAQERKILC